MLFRSGKHSTNIFINGQEYYIDFSSMRQKNSNNIHGGWRQIRRISPKSFQGPSKSNLVWQCLTESGYVPYDPYLNKEIQFAKESGQPVYEYSKNSTYYQIDFNNFWQINLNTITKRSIRQGDPKNSYKPSSELLKAMEAYHKRFDDKKKEEEKNKKKEDQKLEIQAKKEKDISEEYNECICEYIGEYNLLL